MRAKLLRLGAEDHVLILNFHHLISDGASLAVFYRELEIFYSTILAGKPARVAGARRAICRLRPMATRIG